MGKSKGNTGKRYTEAEKRRVLDFIASHGRGGIAAAQKKFSVSYIAIARWQKGIGLNGQTAKASGPYPASKASDIQREIQREVERQIKPHVAHLLTLKGRLKALVQAL